MELLSQFVKKWEDWNQKPWPMTYHSLTGNSLWAFQTLGSLNKSPLLLEFFHIFWSTWSTHSVPIQIFLLWINQFRSGILVVSKEQILTNLWSWRIRATQILEALFVSSCNSYRFDFRPNCSNFEYPIYKMKTQQKQFCDEERIRARTYKLRGQQKTAQTFIFFRNCLPLPISCFISCRVKWLYRQLSATTTIEGSHLQLTREIQRKPLSGRLVMFIASSWEMNEVKRFWFW